MSHTDDIVMTLGVEQHDLLDCESPKTKPIDQDNTLTNTIKKNIIYSCYKKLPKLWEDVVDSIDYVDLSRHSYHQMMYVLHDDIRDKRPKSMTVCCFDKAALTVPNNTILEACQELIRLVSEEGLHQLSFGTIQFPPEHQSKWEKLGKLNAELRILNIDRNIPPLTLHKATMRHMFEGNTGPLIIKGTMWEQYRRGTGLGETIAFAGLAKLKSFLVQAVQYQFVQMDRHPSKRWLGTNQPPPLCTNDDYLGNETMCHFLRQKDEFSIRPKFSNKEQEPPKSASTSGITVKARPQPVVAQPTGASANPQEKQIDQNRPRPATWYGQDYQVNFEPLGKTRNVVVREGDDSAFDTVFIAESENTKRNCNEMNDTDLRHSIEAKTKVTKTIEDNTSDQKKPKKDDDDQVVNLKKEIAKLNKYLDAEEADNKDYKKQVQKLKLDNEALLVEKDLLLITQLKLDREVTSKTEQIRLLEENYTFLKDLFDDRTTWINKEKSKKGKKRE